VSYLLCSRKCSSAKTAGQYSYEHVLAKTYTPVASVEVQETGGTDIVWSGTPTKRRIPSIFGEQAHLSVGQFSRNFKVDEWGTTHISDDFVHHIAVQNKPLRAKDVNPNCLLLPPPILRQSRPSQAGRRTISQAAVVTLWGAKSGVRVPGVI
jgi:hypothetical protein